MFINFSDIPGHQNLFLDYMYEFEKVSDYFRYNFRDTENYNSIFSKISKSRNRNSNLPKYILQQYEGFDISEITRENINSLNKDNSLAVVTGQQLGIFGGPLYTIYKTITTIKLSSDLNKKYPQFNFIPVFWMEGDDHDFNEVNNFQIFDNRNELYNISYDDGIESDVNRGSVGSIQFGSQIENVFSKLDEALRDSDFKEDLVGSLRSVYEEGKSFSDSFREILISLFDQQGLVLFSPQPEAIKNLLSPLFEREITEYRSHTDSVLTRSVELEDAYHAQVKIKPINLFFSNKDGRYPIDPNDDGFKLRGKRISYTKEELLEKVKIEPEKFSPNVLLRPICQDYLLPTAFYVAGPSEISYFAQIDPLYELFNIEPPIVYPRMSASIIEKNVQSILEKYQLDVTDCFRTEKQLNQKVLSVYSDINLKSLFSDKSSEIENIFSELKEVIISLDNSLESATDKTLERIIQSVKNLQSKSESAHERKHETIVRQLSKLRTNLYPSQSLQERELSIIHFQNKYGNDILKWIYEELSMDKFEHQILFI